MPVTNDVTAMDNNSVKDNINRIRREKKITQQEAADRLGLTRQSYNRIEKGRTSILGDNILKLAAALGVSEEELLLGYEPQPSTTALREERERYETRLESYRKTIRHLESVVESQKDTIHVQEQVIEMQRKRIAELGGA